MTRKGLLLLAFWMILGGVLPAAQAATITLRADEWCPYNCAPGDARPGYMVEIAQEIFAAAGHTVEYDTLNWLRSIDETRKGTFTGIIGAVESEAPDFVFGPPLGMSDNAFVIREDTVLDLGRDDPLRGLTVGVIRGYDHSPMINAYVEAHAHDRRLVQFTAGDDALEQNIRKLIAGRIDLAVDDIDVVRRTIHGLGSSDRLRIVPVNNSNAIHIAFSPADPNAKSYAGLLAEGVKRLRASGRLAEILAHYGLEDWQD